MYDHRDFLEMSITWSGLSSAFFCCHVGILCGLIIWLPFAVGSALS